MSPDSKLRRLWYAFRFDPFVAPLVGGCAVLAALFPWLGLSIEYALILLWCVLWALLEHLAFHGWPQSRTRMLTPNFFAVRDLTGYWRVFQRRPKKGGDCREVLRELLADQQRLPSSLTPGHYRALTHDTLLRRLQRMKNVTILSYTPVYMATLEDTVSQAVGRRCRRCAERCPFPGRRKLRQFYDVRWEIVV